MKQPPAPAPRPPPQMRKVADPFSVEPLKLSLATLEWLVDTAHLGVSNASPFGFLLHAARQIPADKRADIASAELARHGIPFGETRQRPSETGTMFKQAIEILAQPESRLKVTMLEPGKEPVLLNVFFKGGLGALGWFDEEAFYVGSPVGLAPLANALVKKLRAGPAPTAEGDVTVWPAMLRTVTRLWNGRGLSVLDSLDASAAARTLVDALGLSEVQATEALDAMVSAGLLAKHAAALALAPRFQPALAALWSQHILELDHALLPPGPQGAVKDVARATERLVFVGPPGGRVLVGGLAGSDLKAETGLSTENMPEGALITLTSLGPAEMEQVVKEFLRVG